MKIRVKPYLFLFASCMPLVSVSFAQQSVPELTFDSVPNYPSLPPGMNFGEVPGVAVNSKGHVFVFTRSNSANGPAYGAAAAHLRAAGASNVSVLRGGMVAWRAAGRSLFVL